MVVNIGTNTASVRQVQSYLIQPASVPFTLYRILGASYQYVFYDNNCNPIYTTPLTVWSNPLTITLPSNTGVPQFIAPNITANCNEFSMNVSNVITAHELCNGNDSQKIVKSWTIKVQRQGALTAIVVNSITINGTSFHYNWSVVNTSQQYTVQIIANYGQGGGQTLFVGSWAINNLLNPANLPIYAFIFGIFLILVAIFGTAYDIRVGIPASIAALLVGQFLGIYNIYVTGFYALLIIGIITMFYLYSRQEQGG